VKKEKRTIHHSIKMTPEEDALLQQRMQNFGIKNQSAFIRKMALNGYMLSLDLPMIKEAVHLTGRLGNNVNQIARRLHEGGSIYETEMDEILEEQRKIRSTLDGILIQLERIGK